MRMEPERICSSEFVIDKSHAQSIKAAEKRIHYLFNVEIQLKEVSSNQQWIQVRGPENGANKAKDYILALTSPVVTICMKNIGGHPLFTPEKEDEIERVSCAFLMKHDDDSLRINGTDLSVTLAQSMIDDMFSKTSADASDTERKREESMSTGLDTHARTICIDLCNSEKEDDEGERRGRDYLNRNNSALSSCMPQPAIATPLAGARYSDGFFTSDPRSYHKIPSSSLQTPFGLVASDACTSTQSDAGKQWIPATDPRTMPWIANRKEGVASEQQGIRFYPEASNSKSVFASASAISPPTLNTPGTQMFGSAGPQSYSNYWTSQTGNVFHTVNHSGDGAIPKLCVKLPTDPHYNGHVRANNLVPSLKSGSDRVSEQVKSQEAYLRSIGLSSYYSSEDIEKGLACYSMEDVVKPCDFLNTLKEIKAHRHGEKQPNTVKTYGRQHVSVSKTSAASTFSKAPPDKATSKSSAVLSVDNYTDLDASVICLGTLGDDQTIALSSEDEEFHDTEENAHYFPVTQNSRTTQPSQTTARREPTEPMDRDISIIERKSIPMEDNCTAFQRPTGHRNLRYIIIDGSNVAMTHGNNKVFSVEGLKICIAYFVKRGHDRITAFVSESRRYSENQTAITRKSLLEKLHNDGYLKFTPARRVDGKIIASYDDRYILNLAEKEDGIVVSNDQFRDLCAERASYRNIVANRLLQFMFVGDHFMPPDDPLGRHGPHLDDFLRYPEQLPAPIPAPAPPVHNNRKDLLPTNVEAMVNFYKPEANKSQYHRNLPLRSKAVTSELFKKLTQLFPEPNQAFQILNVLNNHQRETDLQRLTNYCLNSLSA